MRMMQIRPKKMVTGLVDEKLRGLLEKEVASFSGDVSWWGECSLEPD